MTHFVGLVVAEREEDIRALLQPFHEYECTGTEDEYVIDLDITDEARAAFEADTTNCLKDEAGALHSFFTPDGSWDDRFSIVAANHEPWALHRREKFVPPGYVEVTVPTSEIEEFAPWSESYFGATTVDGRIISRTNPNKKWDWWVVGGRWAGMAPGNHCLIEEVPTHFREWQPSVIVDAAGWHADKEFGWFGSSQPTDTPSITSEKVKEHTGKLVWVVDFHI